MASFNEMTACDAIKGLLATAAGNRQDYGARVELAILTIHERQTADEKQMGGTHHLNGMGWNKTDASFMSSLAEWIEVGTTPKTEVANNGKKGYGKTLGVTLTPKQYASACKVLPKYWRQLAEVWGE